MSITLRTIEKSDLGLIMQWRMDPDITRYMNTDPVLTMEGQLKWLASIQDREDVAYWVIVIDDVPAGVINITGLDREDGVCGWGYYVGEKSKRSLKAALSLEMSMYDYLFAELGKESLTSDVFSLNKGVIQLHLMCGCDVIEERKAAVTKNGVDYDVTYLVMTKDKWLSIRDTKKYEPISFHRTK